MKNENGYIFDMIRPEPVFPPKKTIRFFLNQPGFILSREEAEDVIHVFELNRMFLTAVPGAEFYYSTDFQMEAHHRSLTFADFMYRKRVMAQRTGKFGDEAIDIHHFIEFFVEAAINLAQVNIPHLV